MNSKTQNFIDIKSYFRKNWMLALLSAVLFILFFTLSIFYVYTHTGERKYISSSEFVVINGPETLNLYQGIYHSISTYDDVATVIRSNDVLDKVIADNNLDVQQSILRQTIDIYETSEMQFLLQIYWDNKEESEKINLSMVNAYLNVVESRMDNDNKKLFDVKIVQNPEGSPAGGQIVNKILAGFLFSVFLSSAIILLIILLKTIIYRFRNKQKSILN